MTIVSSWCLVLGLHFAGAILCSSLATFGPSLGGLPESCSGLLSLLLKGHLYRKPFVSTRDTLFTNSLFCLRYLMETASSTILLSMGFHINFSSNTESLSYTITSSFRRLWSTSLPEFLQPAFPQSRQSPDWRFVPLGPMMCLKEDVSHKNWFTEQSWTIVCFKCWQRLKLCGMI